MYGIYVLDVMYVCNVCMKYYGMYVLNVCEKYYGMYVLNGCIGCMYWMLCMYAMYV